MLDYSQAAGLRLHRESLGEGYSLSYIEFTIFLHDVAARPIDRPEHIDHTRALHYHRVAWPHHNVANRISVAPARELIDTIRLSRRCVRMLHFHNLAGQRRHSTGHADDVQKAVGCEQLNTARVLH